MPAVQSCVIFKRPKVETSQVSFNVSMDKLGCIYLTAYSVAVRTNYSNISDVSESHITFVW